MASSSWSGWQERGWSDRWADDSSWWSESWQWNTTVTNNDGSGWTQSGVASSSSSATLQKGCKGDKGAVKGGGGSQQQGSKGADKGKGKGTQTTALAEKGKQRRLAHAEGPYGKGVPWVPTQAQARRADKAAACPRYWQERRGDPEHRAHILTVVWPFSLNQMPPEPWKSNCEEKCKELGLIFKMRGVRRAVWRDSPELVSGPSCSITIRGQPHDTGCRQRALDVFQSICQELRDSGWTVPALQSELFFSGNRLGDDGTDDLASVVQIHNAGVTLSLSRTGLESIKVVSVEEDTPKARVTVRHRVLRSQSGGVPPHAKEKEKAGEEGERSREAGEATPLEGKKGAEEAEMQQAESEEKKEVQEAEMQQAVSEKEKEEDEEEDEEEFKPGWGTASSQGPAPLPSLSLAESEKASEDLFCLAMSVVDSQDVFIMHADEAFRRSQGLLKTLCMRLIFLVARCSGVPLQVISTARSILSPMRCELP